MLGVRVPDFMVSESFRSWGPWALRFETSHRVYLFSTLGLDPEPQAPWILFNPRPGKHPSFQTA